MGAKLTAFQIKELQDFIIIGKSIRCVVTEEENPIPAFWTKAFSDGTIAALEKLPDRILDDVMIGWCGDYDTIDKQFTYMLGVLARPDAEAPEDFESISIPASKFAVGTIEGTEPELFRMAHQLTMDEFDKAGLEYDPDRGCEMEWYDDRFCQYEDRRIIDLYIPVK